MELVLCFRANKLCSKQEKFNTEKMYPIEVSRFRKQDSFVCEFYRALSNLGAFNLNILIDESSFLSLFCRLLIETKPQTK